MSFGDAFSNRWDTVNGRRGMWYCGRFYTEDEIAAIYLAKQKEDEALYSYPSGPGLLWVLLWIAFKLLSLLAKGISFTWAARRRSRAAVRQAPTWESGRIGFRPPGEEGGV